MGVHPCDYIPPRSPDAQIERDWCNPPCILDELDPGIETGETTDDVGSPIVARSVHDDDLEGVLGIGRASNRFEARCNMRRLIAAGNYYSNERRRVIHERR